MKNKLTLSAVTLAVVVCGFAWPRSAESTVPADVAPTRSIPSLEAERLASTPGLDRTDTGALTAEMAAAARGAVTTRSKNFVLEGVPAGRVKLALAGEGARVAVFSSTDTALDARLVSPAGAEVSLAPFSRNDLVEPGATSKIVEGRNGDGLLLVSREDRLAPGVYTLEVSSKVDVVVRDENGPELVLSAPETGFDRRRPVTIQARFVPGARVVASVRGAKGRAFRLAETEPGLYQATIPATKLGAMADFVVEARGTTASGLKVVRHGTIGTHTGDAHADLVAAAPAVWTDTDLTYEVEVAVEAAGRYYVRGNLVGPGGEPIAWAQEARDLAPGRHTLTLRFARELVTRPDARLSDVFLMNVTEAPGVKAPTTID
jgi:hypothetical protein